MVIDMPGGGTRSEAPYSDLSLCSVHCSISREGRLSQPGIHRRGGRIWRWQPSRTSCRHLTPGQHAASEDLKAMSLLPGGFTSPVEAAMNHVREHRSLLASAEKRLLTKIAARLPPWVTADGLSLLGLSAMVAGGLAFAYVGSARWSVLGRRRSSSVWARPGRCGRSSPPQCWGRTSWCRQKRTWRRMPQGSPAVPRRHRTHGASHPGWGRRVLRRRTSMGPDRRNALPIAGRERPCGRCRSHHHVRGIRGFERGRAVRRGTAARAARADADTSGCDTEAPGPRCIRHVGHDEKATSS